MKIKTILSFFILIFFIIIISCSTFKVRHYEFNPTVNCMNCSYSEFIQKLNESGNRYDYRSITLLNDSILMYGKLYGRIGVSTKYKYTLINNNTLVVDSLDIFGRIRPLNESFESIWNLDSLDVGGIIKEISGDRFLYSHDSLINKETGEIYYDKEKWEKRIK